jgi:hypothetical protein
VGRSALCCCGIWLAPNGRSRSATSGGRLTATTPATLSGWSTEVPYTATLDAGTNIWLAWLGRSGKSSDPIWSLVVSTLMFLGNGIEATARAGSGANGRSRIRTLRSFQLSSRGGRRDRYAHVSARSVNAAFAAGAGHSAAARSQ